MKLNIVVIYSWLICRVYVPVTRVGERRMWDSDLHLGGSYGGVHWISRFKGHFL